MSVCSNKAVSSGFTLVELLVVLAIAASIGALTGPDLWRSYQRANERLAVIEYGHNLTEVRLDLMQTKRSISIAEGELAYPGADADSDLPALKAGWSIVSNSEMVFLPTGVTNGGQIEFESPTGRLWSLTLSVLDGKLDVELR